jgi:hypothetical protein
VTEKKFNAHKIQVNGYSPVTQLMMQVAKQWEEYPA